MSDNIINLPVIKEYAEPNENEILDTIIGNEEHNPQLQNKIYKTKSTNIKKIIISLIIFVILSTPYINSILTQLLGNEFTEILLLLLKSIIFVISIFILYIIY